MQFVSIVLIGSLSAALGLLVSYLLWSPHPPVQVLVYQEIQTENPKEGFEELVGYTGKLPFFWSDLVSSRDYRMSVIQRLPSGRTGLLPAPWVTRYAEIDRMWTEQLFLTVRYEQFEPPVSFEKELLVEFEAFAEAFTEAASARGITMRRSGAPVVSWHRSKSPFTLLRSNGAAFAIAAFSAAVGISLVERRKKKADPVGPDNDRAAPGRV